MQAHSMADCVHACAIKPPLIGCYVTLTGSWHLKMAGYIPDRYGTYEGLSQCPVVLVKKKKKYNVNYY